MYKIDERYSRPTVKKIDNITQIIGIDPKNIGIFENFISKEQVETILNACKKYEKTFEYDKNHNHGATFPHVWMEKNNLKDITELYHFAEKIIPIIAKHSSNFYKLEQVIDHDLQYTFHPHKAYLEPHTDVLGWIPKYDETNEYSTQEKYFPYFWSGHLSNIIYLNNDFDGGELFFPDFNIEIKPKPGMLLTFPGNTHYLHGVQEVLGNTRYTCSLWTKFKDFDNTI